LTDKKIEGVSEQLDRSTKTLDSKFDAFQVLENGQKKLKTEVSQLNDVVLQSKEELF
jgi:hypothetical protein